jgi:8-oxo-dGTP diphosphatase
MNTRSADDAADGPADEATTTIVVASGGVVIDTSGMVDRVLVVHRATYDDWSLPKGHVDTGEDIAAAALREVLEETGVRASIVRSAGTTEHDVPFESRSAIKRVHWFVMHPTDDFDPSSRAPDAEVDRAAWWTTTTALGGLTYATERKLLAQVVTRP